jgi:hypothetical protein
MDFQFDATADGRRLKYLNVIDEHSPLCLAIRVGRRFKTNDVVAVLEEHRASTWHQRSSAATPPRIHRPHSQALEREQRHHHVVHRTRFTAAKRLCRVVPQSVQG